jgi:hypothetical protein
MITYLFVDDWEASQVHEGHEDGLIPGAKEAWLLGDLVEECAMELLR